MRGILSKVMPLLPSGTWQKIHVDMPTPSANFSGSFSSLVPFQDVLWMQLLSQVLWSPQDCVDMHPFWQLLSVARMSAGKCR